MHEYLWFDLCYGCLVVSDKKNFGGTFHLEWPDGYEMPFVIQRSQFEYIGEI